MSINQDRRLFIKKLSFTSLTTGSVSIPSIGSLYNKLWEDDEQVTIAPAELTSLTPSALFTVLDLSAPELAGVRKALERKGHDAALAALLTYYRTRYPKSKASASASGSTISEKSFERADNLTKHVFQWGPYAAADYGSKIDWASDPAGDIEWVASVYRFSWANDLAEAYKASGNEKYAETFVELTADWISKHPLEKTLTIVHPVYGHWKGYP